MESDRLPKEIASLTPEQRALLMLRLKKRAISREQQEPTAAPIKPVDRDRELPLSFAQQRLWFLDQLESGSPFYNIFTAVRLSGPLDIAALARSLSEIVRRHEVLRTRFPTVNRQPHQVIDPAQRLRLPFCDLSGLPAAERETAAHRLLLADARRPFDLARGPLMRVHLFRLADQQHILLQTIHHIVSDGWSGSIFVNEVAALYQAFSSGQPSPLPELTIQYADFAVWQREWLRGAGDQADSPLQTQLAYWRAQLADLATLDLPTDHPRPLTQRFRGAVLGIVLPLDLSTALATLSQQEGVTLFMTLLAAFQALLSRYSRQSDISVGSSIANRNRGQIQGLIGFFANTLVLRGDLSGDPTFRELVRRVREVCLGAYAHQDLPFEKLVEELHPARDLSRHPLFQVAFVLQNVPQPASMPSELELSTLHVESDSAKFDLTLTAAEAGIGLVLTMEYNTDLFTAPTIRRMLLHIQAMLAGIVADPQRRIAGLPLLSTAERHQLLIAWNDTTSGVRSQESGVSSRGEACLAPSSLLTSDSWCIHELFAAQAASTPDAVALVFGPTNDERRTTNEGSDSSFVLRPSSILQMTYSELDHRANQLAQHLRALGVGPEVLVGLCVERSVELVIGLLGVLKAGGAYLPLDPAYPIERLAFMLEDAAVPVLLTQERLTDRLPAHAAQEIYLDDDWPMIAAQPADPPDSVVQPDNLAYVIYTSGSTGRPKGVLVAHGGLRNLSDAQIPAFGARADDRALQFASFSFDAAIFEIVMALRAGATLCLAQREALLPGPPLLRLLRTQAISTVTLPPSTLATLPADELPRLRTVIVAGEACPPELAARWSAGRRFCNAYGPTETTVWATVARGLSGDAISIGRPIANAQAYLLDAHMQPAPIGVPGELYLGGAGLARGYLGRPDLTAERFVPNPFATNDERRTTNDESNHLVTLSPCHLVTQIGDRLYRTGDLARYLPDGSIAFLGRLDQQIKLRGYRIELGEVEAMLLSHPDVREAVVLPRAERLVAYIVPVERAGAPGFPGDDEGRRTNDEGSDSSFVVRHSSFVTELRGFLTERLPEYMLPGAFVALDALPHTPSGKLDRNALPAPDQRRATDAAPLQPPQTPIEQQIAAIWCEVLQLDQVGVNDNFFDLGGHSLRMVDVQSRLETRIGREIAMLDLFRYPTISALAAFLRQDAEIEEAPPRETASQPAARETAIAIIGMSGRFPDAPTLEIFWQNLCDGVESIRPLTDDELRAAGVDEAQLNDPNYVKARATLADIELFDAGLFGYTPREAELIDPQQRLFLECAWEALERAGYAPTRLPGRAGLFAGTSLNSYVVNLFSNPEIVESVGGFQAMIGNDKDFLATRAAYKLDLTGPSVTVQTACSTSLVAVHLACQSLRDDECDMALAGGVSISVPQAIGYHYTEGGIGSPDGHCRAFDASAQGTVGGSGVGIVVLKRLADAVADRDTILAVIKGSAINNDGAAKVGYTAPSVEGQAEVIAEAFALAGVDPGTIGYVETHGTGTPLGDPIEIAALTQAFRAATDATGVCALGAVKPNIGHLDAAAGVAGLIKATLAIQHHLIPPLLHFETPNPQLNLDRSPFVVPTRLSPWPDADHPRRAAVSAFGIGGTNAHLILQEPPTLAPAPDAPALPHLLLLSAKTASALEAATDNLAAHLLAHPQLSLADVAATLQLGRAPLPFRRTLISKDTASAAAALSQRLPQALLSAQLAAAAPPAIAFLLPGQGAQHLAMARGLYQHQPRFRAALDRCAELLEPHLGLDIRELLYPTDQRPTTNDQRPTTNDQRPTTSDDWQDTASIVHRPSSEPGDELDQTWLAQPALFAVEYALAQLWMSWGVRPQALLGHSLGEYVAATIAGVFSLDDALRVVAARGSLMQQLPAGAMLSVALSEDQLRELLGTELALAAVNAPSLCVASGPTHAIAALQQRLEAERVECRRLHTSHAFHSSMLEPVIEPFQALLASVPMQPPSIPFLSNLSGEWITAEQATDPAYWTAQMRQTVRFADGLTRLLDSSEPVLLEVGPGQTLSRLARAQAGVERIVLASLPPASEQPQPPDADTAALLGALGKLWLRGASIDWQSVQAGSSARRVVLPSYPFERERYWVEARPSAPRGTVSAAQSAERLALEQWCWVPSWKLLAPLPRATDAALSATAPWLLLGEESELAEQLCARLSAAGAPFVRVRSGASFARRDSQSYTLNPGRKGDYAALLRELGLRERLPRTIVHLWSLRTPSELEEPGAAFAAEQRWGSQSVLLLAQALSQQRGGEPMRLVVVSRGLQAVGAGDALSPAQAPLLGVLTVLAQEEPRLRCRSVDVALPPSAAGLARLAEQVLAESVADERAAQLAYRGVQRWEAGVARLGLGREQGAASVLREGGVYLITGGLGRVGQALGRELARRGRVGLALVQRRSLPARGEWEEWEERRGAEEASSRGIRVVRELEGLGARVWVGAADVADVEQMRAALAAAEAALGPINGVIHAAGVANAQAQRAISELTDVDWERQFRAKVHGVYALAEVLAGRKLDFCVLQSSLAAQLGGLGFGAYAAANRFMDAFAQQRQQADDPIPWLSINWDGWEAQADGAATNGSTAPVPSRRTPTGILPEEGARLLLGLLGRPGLAQVLVSISDLPARFARWVQLEEFAAQAEPSPAAEHARPALSGAYVAPRGATEQAIAAIWQQILGIGQIGAHDNFFELGGHSLLATQVISRIRETLGLELPLRALFEAPTVAGLAQALAGGPETPPDEPITPVVPIDRDNAEQLLASLDELSEAGVDALLDTLLSEQDA